MLKEPSVIFSAIVLTLPELMLIRLLFSSTAAIVSANSRNT